LSSTSEFEDIRLVGVITSQVTQPRDDGTAGSALYAVPIELSASAPAEWAQLFVHNWDQPPRFSTMHRPGIGRVSGKTITLDGTTLEEVEQYHRETLKLAVAETNRQYREFVGRRAAQEAAERERREQHRAHVEDAAKRITFDD
jgi:hypothetical protein